MQNCNESDRRMSVLQSLTYRFNEENKSSYETTWKPTIYDYPAGCHNF